MIGKVGVYLPISTLTQGPIVAQRANFLILLALTTLISSLMLAVSSSTGWETLPTTKWTTGAFFSVLIISLATDSRLTAVSGSSVRVPVLGLGIKPLGPRVLAKGKSLGMVAGVAMRISKSI